MGRTFSRAIVALALALFAPAGVRADQAPLPMEILQQALSAWNARPTPAAIAYDVDFRGRRKSGEFTRRIHVRYDAAAHSYTATVTASSGREPPGVNAERQRLFPDETFGLVPRVRDGVAASDTGSSLQTLAVTRAVARYPYDVTFAGTDTLAGRAAYHLRFAPRSDAQRYPVREVWIDAESFDVRKIVAREVEHAGLIAVPFTLTVEYAEAGPYWLVHSGEAGATAHLLLFTVSAEGAATYANYEFPPSPAR